MNTPIPQHFTGIHWLRSKIPLSELHKQKIFLRLHDGPTVRGGIFTLEARPHCALPEYHHITAERTLMNATHGTTAFIMFDQHRADQIAPSNHPGMSTFVADIDIRRPLQYVPEIQEAVERHLLEALNALDTNLSGVVTEKEFDKEIIRRAMSLLGSRTSERKKASSRANAQKPRRKPSKLAGAETTDKAM